MISIHQPNLDLIVDEESAYEAFLVIARQLPDNADTLSQEVNLRLSWKHELQYKVLAIQEFTHDFVKQIFQPLIGKVAELSPSSPDQRDHPLREFNHEILWIPNNLSQKLIDLVVSSEVINPESLKEYLSYVLIRNTRWQVFLALSHTKQPIWKQ